MQRRLARNQIVLLGIGHTNAHIVRQWRMQPIPHANLVCISDFPVATYSGMLPGVLAAQYPASAMEIDLVRLCGASGCRLIMDRFESVDRANRQILFRNRPPLEYDWLSVGIGSRPDLRGLELAEDASVLPIKPMQTFLERLIFRLKELQLRDSNSLCVVVVGGGLGSVEIAACLNSRHRKARSGQSAELFDGILARLEHLSITILTSADRLAKELSVGTATRIARELGSRGVAIGTNQKVIGIANGQVCCHTGQSFPADLVIWATGAVGTDSLKACGLSLDAKGFALTRTTLQSVDDDRVFVVGDAGTPSVDGLKKAGVYAVRQGPALWQNLGLALAGAPPIPWKPQRDFLRLINLGDGEGIGQFRGRSFSGRWAWRWKDRIDRRFMAMYQDYSQRATSSMVAEPDDSMKMRCLGCGGKVGGDLLTEALAGLDKPALEGAVLLGLDQPDDATIIRTQANQVTCSTDFFASPVDDPALAGRIAVLNALSDLYVTGAKPTAALALIQIPEGHPVGQRRLLRELMAAASSALHEQGVALAGGHTIVGERLAAGFTVLGDQLVPPLTKSGLQAGQVLILSKPLGTGILLAALMQNRLAASDLGQLWQAFETGNRVALSLATEFGLKSMTDVTGFGLAGHLSEMLRASGCSARLDTSALPILQAAWAHAANGVASTLLESNRAYSVQVSGWMNHPAYLATVLFDPQTCGGILLSCLPDQAPAILASLRSAHHAPAVIGQVFAETRAESMIELL